MSGFYLAISLSPRVWTSRTLECVPPVSSTTSATSFRNFGLRERSCKQEVVHSDCVRLSLRVDDRFYERTFLRRVRNRKLGRNGCASLEMWEDGPSGRALFAAASPMVPGHITARGLSRTASHGVLYTQTSHKSARKHMVVRLQGSPDGSCVHSGPWAHRGPTRSQAVSVHRKIGTAAQLEHPN